MKGRIVLLFFIFSFGLQSCWMLNNIRIPRDPNKASKVKMLHRVNGKLYRGRPFYKCNQEPRIGELNDGIDHDRTPIK